MIVLLQRVRDQRQHLLILIQQQHRPQVSQPLVGETRRGEQFQTFDLSEVRPLSQREEVEELGDIVAPILSISIPFSPTISPSWLLNVCKMYLRSELWLSSRKLARIAALSFCTTARSSAMVLEARTLRMNCFTIASYRQPFAVAKSMESLFPTYKSSSRRPRGPQFVFIHSWFPRSTSNFLHFATRVFGGLGNESVMTRPGRRILFETIVSILGLLKRGYYILSS